MLVWPVWAVKHSSLDDMLSWERVARSEQGRAAVRAEMRSDRLAGVGCLGDLLGRPL